MAGRARPSPFSTPNPVSNHRTPNLRKPVETYQVIKDTLVQLPLRRPALPQLVVVVVQTGPVGPEALQARPVDVVDHAPRAARHLPALGQALELALARVRVLALHVVVVVVLAAGADEEGGRQQGGGGGADLLDGRDGGGERGGVVEDGLVEAAVVRLATDVWVC